MGVGIGISSKMKHIYLISTTKCSGPAQNSHIQKETLVRSGVAVSDWRSRGLTTSGRSYYIRNRADKDISYPHVLVRVTTDHEPAVPTCRFPRLASPAFHRRRRGFYLLLVANQSGVDLS